MSTIKAMSVWNSEYTKRVYYLKAAGELYEQHGMPEKAEEYYLKADELNKSNAANNDD